MPHPRILRGIASLFMLLLPLGQAHAATRSIELVNPTAVEVFADSIRALIYAIPDISGEAVGGLIAGRVRLEVVRAEKAEEVAPRECSAAISCILEAPDWEEVILEATPSARLIGPGSAYFQVTGNLVEYEAYCWEAETLAAVLWGPTAGDPEPLEATIVSIRLLFDE
jgi:hypothetical protein